MKEDRVGRELEEMIGKGLGLTKYDDAIDYEMSAFAGTWVDHDGKRGFKFDGLVKKLSKYIEAERTKAAIEELEELKRELSFHTVSADEDEMSKSYVMNTLDFKLSNLQEKYDE